MKAGIIRCMQTEDMCPGTTDFKVMREKKCAFENIDGEIEVIGFNTCGGCKAWSGCNCFGLLYYERKSDRFSLPARAGNQRSYCEKIRRIGHHH